MAPCETKLICMSQRYIDPGEWHEKRAMISISLLIGRRDRKKMTDTVNDIIVRIEDNISFVLSLSCLYESEVLIYGHDRPTKT